jgi:hypothetical protein
MAQIYITYFNLCDLIFQLAYSIFGILGGPLLGIFFLGVLVPRANYKVSQNTFLIDVYTKVQYI